MNNFIICMFVLGLLAPAIAENEENIAVGPYNVSFNLSGSKDMDSYQVEPVCEKVSEDLSSDFKKTYGFVINISQPEKNKEIEVMVTDGAPVPRDETYYKKEVYDMLDGWYGSVSFTDGFEFAPRTIDESSGYVGSGGYGMFRLTSYAAIFFPVPYPGLECRIFSRSGWDEGTLQLLKTIHIKKNEGENR